MPKTPEKVLAAVAIKINVTQDEADLIERARDLDDERKTGTWVRKVTLRAARAALAETGADKKSGAPSRPALHMGRSVDAAENRQDGKKGRR